mmetsp:Transcript_117155/g.343196  ORF Transcript_117155/g.343196 Transcript_117155/m.343196 type:complete len:619 (-) Transcript_117155:34-1890(-)
MKRLISRLGLLGGGGVASYVAWDLSNREWSDRHTWSSAFRQYALYGVLRLVGQWRLRRLLADAEDGEAVQRKLLAELLARHQTTRYGREKGLLGVATLEDFRRVHPLTQHGDYEEYIDRVRKGDEGVLAPGKPDLLAMTSGTSGSPKLVPHMSDVSRTFFLRGVCVAFAVLSNEFPEVVDKLVRSLKLVFRPEFRHLDCGLRIGSNSASPESRGFDAALCAYASPKAAYEIAAEPDALYAHALFALKEAQLGLMEANFAPLVCMLLDTIRENRRSLVQDLRNGHIWDRRLPESAPAPELRGAIDAALGGPDARRAVQVEALLRAGAPAAELWPQLRVVMTTDGGAFQAAGARLRQLLGPGVAVYSPFYAATEGLLGINIFPQRPFDKSAYLLDPGSMVFELLPAQWRDSAKPPADAPVPAWEAAVGEAYEVLVTTRGGLCRYRLGDIVRVVARFGQMPVVTVEERSAHFLPSLHGERVAEAVFLKAMASLPLAEQIRGAAVVDAPDRLPGGRYHVFLEPAGGGAAGPGAEAETRALDEALCREHEVYASFRRKGAVGCVRLHTVEPGTFAALRTECANRGGDSLPPVSGSQVKVPTVLRGGLAERLLSAERARPAAGP